MDFANLELLRQIPYLRSVPAADVQALATSLRERRFRAGDVIFRKGDSSEGLGVVVRGRVRTVISTPEGREQVLKVFGPGRTFADIAVFDDEIQPADAIAVSESIVVFVPRDDLLELLKRHPAAAIEVIRLFASRLRAYKQMVEDLSPHGCRSHSPTARGPRAWRTDPRRGVGQLESRVHARADCRIGRVSARGGPASAQDA